MTRPGTRRSLVCRCELPRSSQSLQYEILKFHDPPTPLALCIVKRPAGRRNLDRPADTRSTTLPIDVAPLERQVFTGPLSGGQGERKQRDPFGLCRGGEESACILRRSGPPSPAAFNDGRSTPTHESSASIFQRTAWRTQTAVRRSYTRLFAATAHD
jgi:hypothetical protein